jgi:hypothetical protein
MGHLVAFSVSLVTEGRREDVEVAKVRSVEVFVRPRNGQTPLNFAREDSLSMGDVSDSGRCRLLASGVI